MKRLALITLGLALAAPMWSANAQEGSDLERIRSELEQARMEVAEAAQELARLQRELVEATGENMSENWTIRSSAGESEVFDFDLEFDMNDIDGRHAIFSGFPPRLGVLLGGTDADQGNRVVGLTPGGGAEQAGIRQDDRLISVAGQDVTEATSERVREILSGLKSGDSVDVVVQRGDGNELVMPVTLGSALRDIQIITENIDSLGGDSERNIVRIINAREGMNAPMPPDAPVPPMPPLIGMLTGLGNDTDLISNHDGLAGYFGTGEGVLVLRIAEDNSMNLASGDVILAVDDEKISRPVDVGRALLDREPDSEITFRVMRDGLETTVYGTIPTSSFRPSGQRRDFGYRIERHFGQTPAAPPAPPAPH